MIKVTIEEDGKLVQVLEGTAVFGSMINQKGNLGHEQICFAVGGATLGQSINALAAASAKTLKAIIGDSLAIQLVVSRKFMDSFSEAMVTETGTYVKKIVRTVPWKQEEGRSDE